MLHNCQGAAYRYAQHFQCFYTDLQHLSSACVCDQCSPPCDTHPFDKRLLDACDVAGTDLDAEGQQGTNTQTLKCKLYQMIKKVRE